MSSTCDFPEEEPVIGLRLAHYLYLNEYPIDKQELRDAMKLWGQESLDDPFEDDFPQIHLAVYRFTHLCGLEKLQAFSFQQSIVSIVSCGRIGKLTDF